MAVTTDRIALLMIAPHHQGGHSDAGRILSERLAVPFPIRMPDLVKRARKDGLDPKKLWPWYAKGKSAHPDQTREGA